MRIEEYTILYMLHWMEIQYSWCKEYHISKPINPYN